MPCNHVAGTIAKGHNCDRLKYPTPRNQHHVMNPDRIRRIENIMNGQARDLPARLARGGLRSLEPVYWTITQLRNRRYDRQKNRVQRLATPVISIGNLTTGGTGKTPLVRWFAEWLLEHQAHPAIVSRGYGSQPGQPNDEYRELKVWLPNTPHVQNPDRVAAANTAITDHQVSVVLLDDGFQHRRLGRDLDIVLIDASNPFGYDHLLPRGLLREPIAALKRADAVILTRIDQVTASVRQAIRDRVGQYMDPQKIAEVVFANRGWIDQHGNSQVSPAPTAIVGFCGIGNPTGFRSALEGMDLQVVDFQVFADHHNYTSKEIDDLRIRAMQKNAGTLVCTMKDLVKVRELGFDSFPVLASTIETEFESGQHMIEDLIQQTLTKKER